MEPAIAQSPIATAADYADAMMAARRAKNWLFILLLIVAVAQLSLFFVARYTRIVFDSPPGASAPAASLSMHNTSFAIPTTVPATGPTDIGTFKTDLPAAGPGAGPVVVPDLVGVDKSVHSSRGLEAVRYLLAVSDFLGIVLVVVLAAVLLLLIGIMLVGRLIGVSKVVSAFIWSLLLGVLYFPWQAFLSQADFKVPGVLFTWAELIDPAHGANFPPNADLPVLILRWSRFVVFPIIALLILLSVHAKSGRGLRMALGEADFESGSDRPIK